MANLTESASWESGIYRIELTDPVVGGEDGIDNVQAKQLGNRTLFLKQQMEALQTTVSAYDPSMQAGMFAGLRLGLDLAGLAMREHEQTRLTRFQEIQVTIKNRGVKSGVAVTKSATATRNLSVSDGIVFLAGRQYVVNNQVNTANVPSNTGSAAGVSIIYMFLAQGVIDVAATALGEEIPDGAIELARAIVPAGNTEANDPYLANVTITDSARREPGWPTVQKAAGTVAVSLNRTLPDAAYVVDIDVASFVGGASQLGQVFATDKLANGFKLMTSGTADTIIARLLVQHPAL